MALLVPMGKREDDTATVSVVFWRERVVLGLTGKVFGEMARWTPESVLFDCTEGPCGVIKVCDLGKKGP
ncbi:hypothetical protein Tco_1106968 [Tanacetum coccineum]